MKSLYPRSCVGDARDPIKQNELPSGGIRLRRFAAAVALSVLLGGTGSLLAQAGGSHD